MSEFLNDTEQKLELPFSIEHQLASLSSEMVSSPKSREEIRFLALLSKTQERAAHVGSKRVKTAQINDIPEQYGIYENNDVEDEFDWRLPKVIFCLSVILILFLYIKLILVGFNLSERDEGCGVIIMCWFQVNFEF